MIYTNIINININIYVCIYLSIYLSRYIYTYNVEGRRKGRGRDRGGEDELEALANFLDVSILVVLSHARPHVRTVLVYVVNLVEEGWHSRLMGGRITQL